jgi:hypothetical protein
MVPPSASLLYLVFTHLVSLEIWWQLDYRDWWKYLGDCYIRLHYG